MATVYNRLGDEFNLFLGPFKIAVMDLQVAAASQYRCVFAPSCTSPSSQQSLPPAPTQHALLCLPSSLYSHFSLPPFSIWFLAVFDVCCVF